MSGVLHVCLTNLSRSATAEAIMRDQLRRMLGVQHDVVPVVSAGLTAHPGAPLDVRAAAELARRGLSLRDFGAQVVSRSLICAADLILTATRAQRDEVAALVPAALFRTFTWREVAVLLCGVEPAQVPGVTANDRARAVAEIASRRRRILVPRAGEQLDVVQVRGRHPLRHRRLARQIDEALAVVTALIVPPEGLAAAAESNLLPVVRRKSAEVVIDLAADGVQVVVRSDDTPAMGLKALPDPVQAPWPQAVPDVVTLPAGPRPSLPLSPAEPSKKGVVIGGWPQTAAVQPVSGISPELAAETAAAIDAVLAAARAKSS